MVYDAQRRILTSDVLLCILHMGYIKNKYSNNDDEINKENLHPLLFIM